jgi:hypothetical protein
MLRQRSSPEIMPVCRFQSQRPTAAVDKVSESKASRSRTSSSWCLRPVMSCKANSQQGWPSNSVARMDCRQVRRSPLRRVTCSS